MSSQLSCPQKDDQRQPGHWSHHHVADPLPSSSHHSTKLLDLIHSDVHGPIKAASFSGYRYWVTYIDDSSRLRGVYLMKKKSEAFSCFQRFKAWAEKRTGCC